MRRFVASAPTGKRVEFEMPDDATPEQVRARANELCRMSPDECRRAGHPDAYPVSSPRADLTEYRCETCDVWFTRPR